MTEAINRHFLNPNAPNSRKRWRRCPRPKWCSHISATRGARRYEITTIPSSVKNRNNNNKNLKWKKWKTAKRIRRMEQQKNRSGLCQRCNIMKRRETKKPYALEIEWNEINKSVKLKHFGVISLPICCCYVVMCLPACLPACWPAAHDSVIWFYVIKPFAFENWNINPLWACVYCRI